MATIVKLENWGMHAEVGDGYTAPELLPKFLSGNVYGHPRKPDGTRVRTSHLVKFDPREGIALTGSGTHYQLGKPDPEYVKSMRELGHEVPGAEKV